MVAAFIALLKRNPGNVPALRPTTPCRLGPTPLLPSVEWQAVHSRTRPCRRPRPGHERTKRQSPSSRRRPRQRVGLDESWVGFVHLDASEDARPFDVRRHVVADTQRKRGQRPGRVVAGVVGEHRRADDEEVLRIPVLQVRETTLVPGSLPMIVPPVMCVLW